MSTTAQENKEHVHRVFDAINEQDIEAFLDLHADDVILHDAGEEVRGREALRANEEGLFESFSNLTATLERMIAEDDTVAFRFTISGTHEEEFEGIPPTGEEIDVTGLGMARFDGGEPVEVWIEADELGLMQQLGAVEAPTD